MTLRRCPLLVGCLATAAAVFVAGCGDEPLPSVKFVGTESCPTASASPKSPSPPDVNSRPPVGQAINEMPATHVVPPTIVQYNHDPPTSGCHYSSNQAPIHPGVYNQSVPPEYWVHNLEHGYIVVLYNCPSPPGCDSEFRKLQEWYRALPADPGGGVGYAKVVILPWITMKPKFAVVSWDWYDVIETKGSHGTTLNMDELQRFYDNHVNQSTEGPRAQ